MEERLDFFLGHVVFIESCSEILHILSELIVPDHVRCSDVISADPALVSPGDLLDSAVPAERTLVTLQSHGSVGEELQTQLTRE